MGARKLAYYTGERLKKFETFSPGDTRNFLKFTQKNCLDYYPFGMLLPNRHESTNEYRYGFNGMEKDDEIKGEGNSYDFGARIYDARVGRWLSVDPMANKYPDWTPYKAFLDNPIIYEDPDGKDEIITYRMYDSKGNYLMSYNFYNDNNMVVTDGTIYQDNSGATYQNYYHYQTTYDVVISSDGLKMSKGKRTVRKDMGVVDSDYTWGFPDRVHNPVKSGGPFGDDGKSQPSGFQLVTKESGVDPVQIKGMKDVKSVEVGDLLGALGIAGVGAIKSLSGSKAKDILEFIKFVTDAFSQGDQVAPELDEDKENKGGTSSSNGGTSTKGGGVNTGNSSGESKNTSYDKEKNRFHMNEKGDTILRYKNNGSKNKPEYSQPTPDLQPVKK